MQIRVEGVDGNAEEEIHEELLKVKKDLNFEKLINRKSLENENKNREIKIDFLGMYETLQTYTIQSNFQSLRKKKII